ncbi:MAG: DUF5107 domain-containing protein [Acidobacteriaceae bacterium]
MSFAILAANAHAAAVHAWQGDITIPTYKLGPSDPNPSFPLVNAQRVYPYTMLDDLSHTRTTRTYKALYLENNYLRVTILPQLGGHVYSVYDKIHHREVFYRNHVIKYGLVGPRGAWISGGIEFSFPFAHTMDCVSPVEFTLRHNPDGSASAMIGAIDWVSNMYWEIALTLRPDTARLQEDVTLFNATSQQHLYLFWTNSAVKATDDLQYVYPMRETIEDDPFAIVQKWPVWNGVDQSWYKNVAPAMAIFGRAVHRNFFGVYYHSSDHGVVHVADYRQDPGKKIWTWGTARSGRIWDTLLSDNDGPYNEIQSGRFYTQGYRQFMQPRRVEQWTEYWYPVSGLKNGFIEATSQLAMNVNFSTKSGSKDEVAISLSPVAKLTGASLLIKQGRDLIAQKHGINLAPLHDFTYTFPVKDGNAAKKNLEVDVISASGKSILHWSAAEPLDGNPDFVPLAGKRIRTEIPDSPQTPTQALYMRGVLLQEMNNLQGAIKVYKEVLQRDPDYIPALLKEGWLQYQAGSFHEAEQLLIRAKNRDEDDPAVQYALGAIYRAEGRLNLAEDGFWTSIHHGGPPAPALVELGEIEIRRGRYLEAEKLLQRAIAYNPDDAFALADLSVAERQAGKPQDAAKSVAMALEKMPLLPYALAEQFEVNHSTGAQASVTSTAADGWKTIMNSDPENYLAVAAWYHSLGAWKSADDVLQAATTGLPAADISPMVSYYLASDARQQGNASEAERYARTAAASRSVAVFPNRLEDYSILLDALRSHPEDAQAKYEMGNFLFAHSRYKKAASLWREASSSGFNNSVLLRNLGVYDWRVQHDLPKAAEDYTRAIQISPHEYRLYPDLDEIYEQQDNASARAELFRNAPSDVLAQDTVQARRIVFLMEQAKYNDALAALASRTFTPWEGGMAMHSMFVFANLQSGKRKLADHQPAQAEKYFRAAMLYPENLGTGEPSNPDTAEQLYWLGNALEAQGRADDAKTAWKQATGRQGGRCRLFPALALQKIGDNSTAKMLLGQCIEAAEQPDAHASVIYQAGIAEQHNGNAEQARKDFLRALSVEPLFWEARIALKQNQP